MSRKAACWAGLVGVLALGATLSAGCGGKDAGEKAAEKIAEKVMEHAAGGETDVDFDKGKVTMKGKDFEMESSEATSWPDDMPGAVPRFGYGKVERVARAEEKSDQSMSYNVWFRDVPADAAVMYKDDLEKAGWVATIVDMGEQGALVSAQKDDHAITFMQNKEEKRANLLVTTE